MQFDIRSNVRDVSRWLTDAEKKQLPFATVLAMTMTAREVKAEEQAVMRRVFDRPTPYAVNALQVKPATKRSMVASVEFKDGFGGTPAKRFLNPEVHGGARSRKGHELALGPLLGGASYLVPAPGVALDRFGNVPPAQIRRIMSQLKVMRDDKLNATGSRRSKRNRRASAFFVTPGGRAVMERKGDVVAPVLVAVSAPAYTKRFPFHEVAGQVVARRLDDNFEAAFQRAMAHSGYRSARGGTWKTL